MIPAITLTMINGVRIVVPDSLDLITPYVLREQQDWFEDEIKFLRRLLQQGDKVIDIGANCGVYSLSMAQTVGPTGHVWAFEPASSTAKLLAEGIVANGFAHITLEQAALSNFRGVAQLSLNMDSEMNALVLNPQSTSVNETVPVKTLDDCLATYDWQNIDFIKIDAEGEEANILEGGKRFFKELSPLVQYEVEAGYDFPLELLQAFAGLGYDSYRLVPGLDILIPFDSEAKSDEFMLNLFCCKPDRANQLATQGFLLNSAQLKTGVEHLKDKLSHNDYNWSNTLSESPYGKELATLWKQTMHAGSSVRLIKALSFYSASRDSSLSLAARFHALTGSFIRFSFLCEQAPTHLRRASLARVARDYGARSIAANALSQLINTVFQHNQLDPSEPFLAPCERFDSISPGKALGDWVLSSILESFECIGSFSSFYTGDSARQRLEMIRDMGFGSAEMERRLKLLQQRLGLQ